MIYSRQEEKHGTENNIDAKTAEFDPLVVYDSTEIPHLPEIRVKKRAIKRELRRIRKSSAKTSRAAIFLSSFFALSVGIALLYLCSKVIYAPKDVANAAYEVFSAIYTVPSKDVSSPTEDRESVTKYTPLQRPVFLSES